MARSNWTRLAERVVDLGFNLAMAAGVLVMLAGRCRVARRVLRPFLRGFGGPRPIARTVLR